jgi:hypothetical protein
VLDPGFPSNTGGADFAIVGTKETCEFDFDWTFSDIQNHPVQVTRSTAPFGGAVQGVLLRGRGVRFELQAQIPKKD